MDQLYIRTANNDKSSAETLNVRVGRNVKIFIGVDTNLALPEWLREGSGWQKLGEELTTSSDGNRDLYQKNFSSGIVELGGNEGQSWNSMYTVIIAPNEDDTYVSEGLWENYR